MHLRQILDAINATLTNHGLGLDDTTRAHLLECQWRIDKVLNASMQVNEP
jgi:hypothetical protein